MLLSSPRVIPALLATLFAVPPPSPAQEPSAYEAYRQRVETIKDVPGFVALWDFVKREDGPGGHGRFIAHTAPGDGHQYALEARNIILAFWGSGREATYADFPLAGRGPFGDAVRFQTESEDDFLPVLLVPRAELHDSRLDVKGPGASVSMVVWLIHEQGNHVMAGIWHEGTDITEQSDRAAVVEAGRRQYALFAGLAANPGAAAVHVSENGGSSFGDKYARNLAVTREKIPTGEWAVAGFVFDNDTDTATAYLNGQTAEYWIDDPAGHPFFQWPARGWTQADRARQPGHQPGELPDYPPSQYYQPPEQRVLEERVESESATERVVVRTYEFTRVRETLRQNGASMWQPAKRELVGLKVNPYWFSHDFYAPRTVEEGGPFTIGRVIKSSRGQGNTAYYGGVAVFDRALAAQEMAKLSELGPPLERKAIMEAMPR